MKKSIKTTILSILLTGTMAFSAIGFAGCSNGGNNPNPGPNTQKNISFRSACDSSVLGGIGLLNSTGVSGDVSTLNVASYENAPIFAEAVVEDTEKEADKDVENTEKDAEKEEKKDDVTSKLTDAQKQEILANLAIAQNTLNGGAIKSEVKPSEREGYQYYYTISAADITGKDQIYTFYYNSNLTPEEEEQDEEDDENEQEMSLDGIVILDGVEYTVTGKKEVEGDESELEFIVKLSEKDYVIIAQEMEGEETEFSYESFKDGVSVYKTEVEYEVNEKGDIELEFEMESNGEVIEYSYEFVKSGTDSLVKVEMLKAGQEMEAVIKITANENGDPVYEFVEKGADEEVKPDVAPEENNNTTPDVAPENGDSAAPETTPDNSEVA